MPSSKEQNRKRSLAYYYANRDKVRLKMIERYLKRTESKVRSDTLLRRAWKEKSPRIYLWSASKYRAKKQRLDFNLTREDIIIPYRCPYLGLVLTSEKGSGRLDNLMSVDRIDPRMGYVKGNVEVISYKANRMKNDATAEQLITFAENILKRHAQGPIS